MESMRIAPIYVRQTVYHRMKMLCPLNRQLLGSSWIPSSHSLYGNKTCHLEFVSITLLVYQLLNDHSQFRCSVNCFKNLHFLSILTENCSIWDKRAHSKQFAAIRSCCFSRFALQHNEKLNRNFDCCTQTAAPTNRIFCDNFHLMFTLSIVWSYWHEKSQNLSSKQSIYTRYWCGSFYCFSSQKKKNFTWLIVYNFAIEWSASHKDVIK